MVQTTPTKFRAMLALEGYSEKALSEKLGTDIGKLREKLAEVKTRKVLSLEEKEELIEELKNARDKCAGLNIICGWLADALLMVQEMPAGIEIPASQYSSYTTARKNARVNFTNYLKKRFKRVVFFPAELDSRLPEGAELVKKIRNFKLYGRGNKFFFVGRKLVWNKGRVFDLGEKVLGEWVVES